MVEGLEGEQVCGRAGTQQGCSLVRVPMLARAHD